MLNSPFNRPLAVTHFKLAKALNDGTGPYQTSMLRRAMSVQVEGKTDLLKISFPHRDPGIAATLAEVAAQAELLSVAGGFNV